MKSAVPSQKEDIIIKTIQTFDIRRFLYMNENFFKVFPGFIDVPELIDVEFKLLFPEIDPDNFLKIYPKFISAVLHVSEVEKQEKVASEWDRGTAFLITSTQLVPPIARCEKNAGKARTKIVDELILLRPIGTPLQLKGDANSRQPKFLAVEANKAAISQYHINIDEYCISLKAKNILEAIDSLFKAHYVFNVEFVTDLQDFWTSLQHNFYGISSHCTNQMIDIYSKLEAAKLKLKEH